METEIIKDMLVEDNGIVDIPYEKFKGFFDPTMEQVPYKFNIGEDKFAIELGYNKAKLEKYKQDTPVRHRQLINFRLLEIEKAEELKASRKEKIIRFDFKSSKHLEKFLGKIFYITHLEEQSETKVRNQIIFKFKDIEYQTEHLVTIKNGVFTIQKIAPPNLLDFILKREDYAIMKIYSLMSKHSKKLRESYDLLISFRPNILNYLQIEEKIDKRKYTKTDKDNYLNFYISRKKFEEFLKPTPIVRFIIEDRKSNQKFSFELDESIYNRFLKEVMKLPKKEIKILQKNASKGTSAYYDYVKDFLEYLKTDKIDVNEFPEESDYLEELRISLDNAGFILNFKNLNDGEKYAKTKRTSYVIISKIIFLDNNDILITRDLKLKIRNNIDLIVEDTEKTFKKGKELYEEEFADKLDKGLLVSITPEESSLISNILKELRLRSQENLSPSFIRESFYYISIIKTSKEIYDDKYKFNSEKINELIAIYFGIYTSFAKNFPKNPFVSSDNIFFFMRDLLEIPSLNKAILENVISFTRDLIFLYECAQDLKYYKEMFSDKFEDPEELNNIIRLSYILVRAIFTRITTPHETLSSAVFSMFLIAINKDKDIPLSAVCGLEKIDISQYSLSSQIESLKTKKTPTSPQKKRPSLKVTKEKSREEIRSSLIEIILGSQLDYIMNLRESSDNSQINKAVTDFFNDFKFFHSYEDFNNSLILFSGEFKKLSQELEKIKAKLTKINKTSLVSFVNQINEMKPTIAPKKIPSIQDLEKLKEYYELNKEELGINEFTNTFQAFKDSFSRWVEGGELPKTNNKTEELLIKSTFKNILNLIKKDFEILSLTQKT